MTVGDDMFAPTLDYAPPTARSFLSILINRLDVPIEPNLTSCTFLCFIRRLLERTVGLEFNALLGRNIQWTTSLWIATVASFDLNALKATKLAKPDSFAIRDTLDNGIQDSIQNAPRLSQSQIVVFGNFINNFLLASYGIAQAPKCVVRSNAVISCQAITSRTDKNGRTKHGGGGVITVQCENSTEIGNLDFVRLCAIIVQIWFLLYVIPSTSWDVGFEDTILQSNWSNVILLAFSVGNWSQRHATGMKPKRSQAMPTHSSRHSIYGHFHHETTMGV